MRTAATMRAQLYRDLRAAGHYRLSRRRKKLLAPLLRRYEELERELAASPMGGYEDREIYLTRPAYGCTWTLLS